MNPKFKPWLWSVLALVLAGLTCSAQVTVDPFNPGADEAVVALAIQADGKVLVGGKFNQLEGTPRNHIGRLHSDGRLDQAFNPGSDGPVNSIAIQTDGKILVGGLFTRLAGESRSRLARLNPDGTLDAGFHPEADFEVCSLVVQPDGKILVAGRFRNLGGKPCDFLGRLNPDGSRDAGFQPNPNSDVYSVGLQADGKVIIGGYFSTLGGARHKYLGRLNADGSVDPTFTSEVNSFVYSIAEQADGKILLGGFFSTLGGKSRGAFGRLERDGRLDDGFNPLIEGPNAHVSSLAVQHDGKILIGGRFTAVGGQARTNLARLNPDGSVDAAFHTTVMGEPDFSVFALALQDTGKILVGGSFTNLAGEPRRFIGRLNNTEPVASQLGLLGSKLVWRLGKASPEFTRVSVELSADGTGWAGLGAATRTAEGWELRGISVPANHCIRAQGFLQGGQNNASGWYVEAGSGKPFIAFQPAAVTNAFGEQAVFSVIAHGSPPLGFQWMKNGSVIENGGTVSGATTATLTFSKVAGDQAADYAVVITNSYGRSVSRIAQLTVQDPAILLAPTNTFATRGASVVLHATAAGTQPLRYQWFRHGVALAGATADSLTLNPVQAQNAGAYSVAVRNAQGSCTSSVANLTVNLSSVEELKTSVNDEVSTFAIQADGGIVFGGAFTKVDGQPRGYLARMNHAGFLDETFRPGPVNDTITSLALQRDRKIVVGGNFTTWGDQQRNRIVRLNPDGSLDTTFNSGANDAVVSVAIQPDGKIIIGGFFATVAEQSRSRIARLNSDGTPDPDFNPGASFIVDALAVQPDGRIVVGGRFKTLGGQPRDYLGRLHPDGTLDTAFNPGANGWVSSLAIQPDGKILVGGEFTKIGEVARSYLARLNPDGTLDRQFNPAADAPVLCLKVQPGGRILVGGDFSRIGGQLRQHMARLEADGQVDQTFNPGASHRIYALAQQADGRILVGGRFTSMDGKPIRHIARIKPDGID
ncbi:MAG: hypothetical protein H7Y43_08595 [Akkermansiaceae bacterium]|nr:hypothetical protein [Verrucomicrobiales bacterium]